MTLAKPFLWIAALTTVISIPQLGHAQTCLTTSDCPKGMSCQADPRAIAPAPACPPGTDCTTVAPSTTQSMTCRSAPCQVDTDCASGMVCSTSYQCRYKWEVVACNVNTDCGDGFVCQPTTSGSCSGSGSSGGSSYGTGTTSATTGGASGSGGLPSPLPVVSLDAGPVPGPVCTTTTSFPGTCQAEYKPCNADADCPATFTCVAPSYGIVTGGSSSGGTDGGSAPTDVPALPAAAGQNRARATAHGGYVRRAWII